MGRGNQVNTNARSFRGVCVELSRSSVWNCWVEGVARGRITRYLTMRTALQDPDRLSPCARIQVLYG